MARTIRQFGFSSGQYRSILSNQDEMKPLALI